ncbi:MAG TPA: neutral zinc metallopeptidase [Jatrophihabitans sp.]|jgi:predicted metalloprotease
MRRRLLVALAAAVLLSGCAVRIAGVPTGHASAGRNPLDCSRPTAAPIVQCLTRSLSTFWTHTLARPVQLHVRVDPDTAEVPRACRAALQLNSAFSCPIDDVVYLTAPFLHRLRTTGPAADGWVRIASTAGHEMGHIVQFAVHAPLLDIHHPSWAQSRAIEQQADCLAGVWSASVGIAQARFRAATAIVLHVVDSRWERRSHGTPARRLAALQRGQRARTPAACGLSVAPR